MGLSYCDHSICRWCTAGPRTLNPATGPVETTVSIAGLTRRRTICVPAYGPESSPAWPGCLPRTLKIFTNSQLSATDAAHATALDGLQPLTAADELALSTPSGLIGSSEAAVEVQRRGHSNRTRCRPAVICGSILLRSDVALNAITDQLIRAAAALGESSARSPLQSSC
jgi:hypothetical protein